MTQRLIKRNMTRPRAQVLIYPWLQLVTTQTPSYLMYHSPFLASITVENLALWYMGIDQITNEMLDLLQKNEHLLLLDESTQNKMKNFFNLDLIPKKYKHKTYYDQYKHQNLSPFKVDSKTMRLDESHILMRDKNLANKLKQLFLDDVSPGLSESSLLEQFPSTLHIVCEMDPIKDENLVFAGRMQMTKVNYELAFYEKCYHGMAERVNREKGGYEYAIKMLDDTVEYLKRELL